MFGQNNDQNELPDDQGAQAQSGDNGFSVPAPGAPVGPIDQNSHSSSLNPFSQPLADDSADDAAPEPTVLETPVSAPVAGADDLLDIKQDALHELKPLVGHLEQSPDEKFRTTMMMIQASDDHSLVKIAYDAAKQITDEKARAQALLDVVNEINYFTQQKQN